jgi:serine/threonine protein kinase
VKHKLLQTYNVSIDGIFATANQSKCAFFRAFFKSRYPRIVKVPAHVSEVDKEIDFFQNVTRRSDEFLVEDNLIPLVPIKKLNLPEPISFKENPHTADKLSGRAGILMPFYPNTLNELVAPIEPDYALEIFDRVMDAINRIHSRRYIHVDIKCSNIFLDATGLAFLGDYGSCGRYGDSADLFQGTLQYQCGDVRCYENPRLFDTVGLVISILVKSVGEKGVIPASFATLNDLCDCVRLYVQHENLRNNLVNALIPDT